MDTATIVRQCQLQVRPAKEYVHRERVMQTLCIIDPSRREMVNPSIALEDFVYRSIINAGFRFFVSRQEVYKRFKYHAGIKGSYAIAKWWLIREVINYVGDIPEFVLDNMAKLEWFAKSFTIHSMQPLPVEKKLLMLKIDPVMVAWLTPDVGVVVGIWDGDKELEL